MNGRNVFGLTLLMILLLLAVGSGLAQAPPPTLLPASNSADIPLASTTPWFNFEVDTSKDTGQYPSMAVDPSDGYIYISYYDVNMGDLRLARHGGTAAGVCGPDYDWDCSVVEGGSGDDFGMYSSIALDPSSDGMGIAYHDASNGKLKYAYFPDRNSSAKSVVTIDEGITSVSWTGLYTSLQYASDGSAYIAYQFNNPSGVDALKLAFPIPAGGNCGIGAAEKRWRCETIMPGEGVGQHASLAIGPDGQLHIAYYFGGPGELWHATSRKLFNGNCGPGMVSWSCYKVAGYPANVGQYASIFVDKDNNFHIAYYNATNYTLSYAVSGTSSGNCFYGNADCIEIDDMPVDTRPHGISIAEDAAGYPIIAYQSADSLRLARPIAALGLSETGGNCGPDVPLSSWYCETIDRAPRYSTARHADYVSIAVGPSGLAAIAYNEYVTADDGNLAVAWQQFQTTFMPLVVRNQ